MIPSANRDSGGNRYEPREVSGLTFEAEPALTKKKITSARIAAPFPNPTSTPPARLSDLINNRLSERCSNQPIKLKAKYAMKKIAMNAPPFKNSGARFHHCAA